MFCSQSCVSVSRRCFVGVRIGLRFDADVHCEGNNVVHNQNVFIDGRVQEHIILRGGRSYCGAQHAEMFHLAFDLYAISKITIPCACSGTVDF